MTLDELGARICILGPSNSGKSTLAAAIGRADGRTVVHLDQLRHYPGTQWELRPDDEFARLHDEAIAGERWVIEGNYSTLLPQRLARATSLVLLDASASASLLRYFVRTRRPHSRIGGLDGMTDRVSWDMVRYILGAGQSGRRRHRRDFGAITIPKVFISNRRALDRFYRDAHLTHRVGA
jgi:adenylate kinase family enzyme